MYQCLEKTCAMIEVLVIFSKQTADFIVWFRLLNLGVGLVIIAKVYKQHIVNRRLKICVI